MSPGRALPEWAGLELCRQIWDAARDSAVHLPVLTLTSATRPEDVCAGYPAGADLASIAKNSRDIPASAHITAPDVKGGSGDAAAAQA